MAQVFYLSIRFLLVLLLATPNAYAVTRRCEDQFAYELTQQTYSLDGQEYQVSVLSEADRQSVRRTTREANRRSREETVPLYEADRILPNLDTDRRVIIGFNDVHTYINYRGVRLDTQPGGMIGVNVRSRVRPANNVYGDLLFVIHDLPDETLRALDDLVANLRRTGRPTCVVHTCEQLNQALPNLLSGDVSIFPSTILRALLRAKANNEMQIEIVSLARNPESTIFNITVGEKMPIAQLLMLATTVFGFIGYQAFFN